MKITFNKNKEFKNTSQKSLEGAKYFEQFYYQSIKKLIHITYGIVQNKSVAEGIVHDILIDIWERRDTIVINVSLEAYAIKAAKFKSFDYLKAQVKKEKLAQELLTTQPNFHNDVEETVDVQDLKTEVNLLTKLLPKRCQEVFRLSREKAMSNREIATGLQISEKTVEKHMTKAIKHLRLGLEKN